MALSVKQDPEQWQQLVDAVAQGIDISSLVDAVNNLSTNLAKWQSQQTNAIVAGFSDLIRTLGGTGDEQMQALINQLATNLKLSTDEVEAAIKQANPIEGETE